MLRRVNKDVSDLANRLVQILGSPKSYNNRLHTWKRAAGKFVELSGRKKEKDKQRFKGTLRDFIG